MRELNEQCARALGYEVLYADGGFGETLYLHDAGAIRESESVTANAHLFGARWERLRANGEVAEYFVRLCPAFSDNHEAARILEDEIERRGRWHLYVNALLSIVLDQRDADLWMVAHVTRAGLWELIRATPEQRAQAFLKAIEEVAA